MDTLRELFVEQLQDAYDAEHQIIKALPKMAKNASSSELRAAFENHLEQTKEQVERLETIFENLDEEPRSKTCKGMAGVIAEGKEALEEEMDDDVRDAAMIGAAQKVEHYEIALYGTLKTFASLLDEEEAVSLLEETLNEEKETDRLLTELSEEVNPRAEGERSMESERPRRSRTSAGRPSQRQTGVSRQAKSSSRGARKR